jgi:opacity protein-like surface antigen
LIPQAYFRGMEIACYPSELKNLRSKGNGMIRVAAAVVALAFFAPAVAYSTPINNEITVDGAVGGIGNTFTVVSNSSIQLSRSVTNADGDFAKSRSNLGTGSVGVAISTPDNDPAGARAIAIWQEGLLLDSPELRAGRDIQIGIGFDVEGSYTPKVTVGLNFSASSRFDTLGFSGNYAAEPSRDSGTFFASSPAIFNVQSSSGNFSKMGPDRFVGVVDISATDPFLNLKLALNASGRGNANFFNSANFFFTPLPSGTTFSSTSGEFLSATSVPTPGSLILLVLGLATLGLNVLRAGSSRRTITA